MILFLVSIFLGVVIVSVFKYFFGYEDAVLMTLALILAGIIEISTKGIKRDD